MSEQPQQPQPPTFGTTSPISPSENEPTPAEIEGASTNIKPMVAPGTMPEQAEDTSSADEREAARSRTEGQQQETALETTMVTSGREDDRVVLWERHPEHPQGEVFVGPGDKPVEVGRTPTVERLLASGELVEGEAQAEPEPAPEGKARSKGKGEAR